MGIEGLRVEMELHRIFSGKEEAEEAAAKGTDLDKRRPVIKRVYVKPSRSLSERDVQVLRNTMKHCPLGRMFSGGDLEFQEELIIEGS